MYELRENKTARNPHYTVGPTEFLIPHKIVSRPKKAYAMEYAMEFFP